MKYFLLSLAIASTAVTAQAAQDVKRLSPVPAPSQIPAICRVVNVMKDSPAQKAGIVIGDVIQSVNGKSPADASGFSELVGAAPQESDFKILNSSGLAQDLQVRLNAGRPRLGAVCDLTGWRKPGVTAAGNESVTIFNGPYALTVSGIIDKGLIFLRVRLANDSDRTFTVSPSLFNATDGNGSAMAILSPKDVMCQLYGEKGAHLLALKKKHTDSMDTHESALLGADSSADEKCPSASGSGRLRSSEAQYAEANAQYLAQESLWPAAFPSGQVADGLIYFNEPARLPVTVSVEVDSRTLSAQLGMPVASENQMKIGELRKFFEAEKKGNSVRLTLRKGKVFVGKFSSYDAIDERAWFNTPSGGMLNTTSFSLDVIRSAEPLDPVPSKPGPGADHLN